MTALARDRRMLRLLTLGEQAARASEVRFARCVAQAADAAASLSHIEGLILTAAPLRDARGVTAIAAAAHLRALLLPAAEAAAARLQDAVADRRTAEAALVATRERARRLADQATGARRALANEVADKEGQDRPISARTLDFRKAVA